MARSRWLTGGTSSPLFHWILALPIVIAVVLPDLPGAAVGCGAALVIDGGLLLGWAGEPLAGLVRWMAQAVVGDVAGLHASATYRRLRMRETPPPDAQDVAGRARPGVGGGGRGARRVPRRRRARAAHAADVDAAAHRGDRTDAAAPSPRPETTMQVPPTEQKRIAAVARQARRLSGLIDSMLDVSKLTGRTPVARAGRGRRDRAGREIVHRFTPDAAAAACPLTLRLDTPRRPAGRDPPRSDHHEPDRQRAEVRRRLAHRDRGRGRRAGDPPDRPRSRHRHLARRSRAHLPPLRARRGRAPVLGRRPGPLDHERAGQGAGRPHQPPQHPGRGRPFTVVLPRRPTTSSNAAATPPPRPAADRRCILPFPMPSLDLASFPLASLADQVGTPFFLYDGPDSAAVSPRSRR